MYNDNVLLNTILRLRNVNINNFQIRVSYLALYTYVIIFCIIRFNVRKCYTLATQCIYVFGMDLRTTGLYYPMRSSWLAYIIETERVFTAR
jgi:hypothetical protein